MSAANPVLPVTLGVANGASIVAQTNSGALASTRTITLTADYAHSAPPGYPVCDAGSRALLACAQTIASGSTIMVYADEAAALSAAGVAA